MRKSRQREIKQLALDLAARKWWSPFELMWSGSRNLRSVGVSDIFAGGKGW